MPTRIALQGFGPVARCVARIVLTQPELGLELVAVAERSTAERCAQLLRRDSVYGPSGLDVGIEGCGLVVGGRSIPIVDVAGVGAGPGWGELGVDVVIEGARWGRRADRLQEHLACGARRVLLAAAPVGPQPPPTVFFEAGLELPGDAVVAAGSRTGAALHPLVSLLNQRWGIRALSGTVLAPLAEDQVLHDDLHHPCAWRARAAGGAIVPTTRGAGRSILSAFSQLRGRLLLESLRVPVGPVGCLALVAQTEGSQTVDAVIDAARDAAAGPLAGVLGICDEPLVSADFRGRSESAMLDLMGLDVTDDGRSVALRAWYDATWGYAARLVDLARLLGERGD